MSLDEASEIYTCDFIKEFVCNNEPDCDDESDEDVCHDKTKNPQTEIISENEGKEDSNSSAGNMVPSFWIILCCIIYASLYSIL